MPFLKKRRIVQFFLSFLEILRTSSTPVHLRLDRERISLKSTLNLCCFQRKKCLSHGCLKGLDYLKSLDDLKSHRRAQNRVCETPVRQALLSIETTQI